MNKIEKDSPLSQSKDLVQDNIHKLKELFPEIVTENKIDFNALQEVLGEEVEDGEEYYRFTWAGKAKARREAHKPSTGTLRPAKDESVDWETTKNLYIEGDNLEVLKLMQKSYAGKVKMIYIDPPYNTGKDFVYKDNYKDNLRNYQELTGQVDAKGNKLSTNSDTDGRYHSNWLNMMYPRLRLARNLLKDDGVIFISLDDNESTNSIKICNEIFGEENFVEMIIWKKRSGPPNDKIIAAVHEYILVYAKNISKVKLNLKERSEKQLSRYRNPDNHHKGRWASDNLMANVKGGRFVQSLNFPIVNPNTKEEHYPSSNGNWRYNKEKIQQLLDNDEIFWGNDGKGRPKLKRFLSEVKSGVSNSTLWDDVVFNNAASAEISKILGNLNIFDTPKPSKLIINLLKLGSEKNSVILDFFSGSATTAHAVMQLNAEDGGERQHIQVQLPEFTDKKSEAYKAGYTKLTDIGKERIRRAAKKIATEHPEKAKKLDLGFKVFKLDTSNIRAWDGATNNLEQDLWDAVNNIKEDRTEEDVLYEILLKYGLDLSLPVEERTLEGNRVFNVSYGALFICLADKITNKTAEAIGKWLEELKQDIKETFTSPEVQEKLLEEANRCRVIFKDSGFTDVEKTNAIQTLKRFGIEEVRSV